MATHTLIIWLWEESIDEQNQVWRGTVSQVQSGHLVPFQTLDGLYRQIARLVDDDPRAPDRTDIPLDSGSPSFPCDGE